MPEAGSATSIHGWYAAADGAVDARARAPRERALGVEVRRRVDERDPPDDALAAGDELALDGRGALGAGVDAVRVGRGDDRRLVERRRAAAALRRGRRASQRARRRRATRATQQARPPLRKNPRTAWASFAPGRNGPACGRSRVAELRRERLEGVHPHRAVQRAGRREAGEAGDRALQRIDAALGQRQRAEHAVDLGPRLARHGIGAFSMRAGSGSPCPFVRPSVPCRCAARR